MEGMHGMLSARPKQCSMPRSTLRQLLMHQDISLMGCESDQLVGCTLVSANC